MSSIIDYKKIAEVKSNTEQRKLAMEIRKNLVDYMHGVSGKHQLTSIKSEVVQVANSENDFVSVVHASIGTKSGIVSSGIGVASAESCQTNNPELLTAVAQVCAFGQATAQMKLLNGPSDQVIDVQNSAVLPVPDGSPSGSKKEYKHRHDLKASEKQVKLLEKVCFQKGDNCYAICKARYMKDPRELSSAQANELIQEYKF